MEVNAIVFFGDASAAIVHVGGLHHVAAAGLPVSNQ